MAGDPAMNEYRAFAKQYMADLDLNDVNAIYAYGVAGTLVRVLTA